MYVIKHVPEDFEVVEIADIETGESGPFTIFRLKKRDYSTLQAVARLAKVWGVPSKRVGFAGIKDRRAVTEQVCSVKGVSRERVERTNIPNITVEFLGFADEPVRVGRLEGNRFRIVVRNIDALPAKKSRFRNLFGKQRFSGNNVDVGRCLVKGEFERAALLLAGQSEQFEEKMRPFREQNDWVGAVKCVPFRVLKLMVNAYQSWVWNRAAKGSDADVLPLVGFGTEKVPPVMREILDEEGVSPSDFVVRAIPEVSAEGGERNVWVEAEVKVGELLDDEFFPGKKKVVLGFFLPKGSYATVVVAQLFQ